MPVVYKEVARKEKVRDYLVCDACQSELEHWHDALVVSHTFGFGTPMDMSRVNFVLCDTCLMNIIKERIPGVIITRPD